MVCPLKGLSWAETAPRLISGDASAAAMAVLLRPRRSSQTLTQFSARDTPLSQFFKQVVNVGAGFHGPSSPVSIRTDVSSGGCPPVSDHEQLFRNRAQRFTPAVGDQNRLTTPDGRMAVVKKARHKVEGHPGLEWT